jgi:hypothetical protein
MKETRHTFRIRFSLSVASLVFTGLLLVGSEERSAIATDDTPSVVRVEEDWELVIAVPDSNSIAPQVTCTISPNGSVSSLHATFDINHHSQPDFIAGGLQLQTWNEEWPLMSHNFPEQHVISSDNDIITWTQVMAHSDGSIVFEILNGHSTTWGHFGGQGYLHATASTSLSNLNGYDPNTSTSNSGVAYAANRVTSLTLKRIRWFLSTGDVVEDSNPRVVHHKD